MKQRSFSLGIAVCLILAHCSSPQRSTYICIYSSSFILLTDWTCVMKHFIHLYRFHIIRLRRSTFLLSCLTIEHARKFFISFLFLFSHSMIHTRSVSCFCSRIYVDETKHKTKGYRTSLQIIPTSWYENTHLLSICLIFPHTHSSRPFCVMIEKEEKGERRISFRPWHIQNGVEET